MKQFNCNSIVLSTHAYYETIYNIILYHNSTQSSVLSITHTSSNLWSNRSSSWEGSGDCKPACCQDGCHHDFVNAHIYRESRDWYNLSFGNEDILASRWWMIMLMCQVEWRSDHALFASITHSTWKMKGYLAGIWYYNTVHMYRTYYDMVQSIHKSKIFSTFNANRLRNTFVSNETIAALHDDEEGRSNTYYWYI